jgi:transposase-like protein
VSRSQVSRICARLDERVEAFRTRPLEGRYLRLFLDAKMEKARDGGWGSASARSSATACARPAGRTIVRVQRARS